MKEKETKTKPRKQKTFSRRHTKSQRLLLTLLTNIAFLLKTALSLPSPDQIHNKPAQSTPPTRNQRHEQGPFSPIPTNFSTSINDSITIDPLSILQYTEMSTGVFTGSFSAESPNCPNSTISKIGLWNQSNLRTVVFPSNLSCPVVNQAWFDQNLVGICNSTLFAYFRSDEASEIDFGSWWDAGDPKQARKSFGAATGVFWLDLGKQLNMRGKFNSRSEELHCDAVDSLPNSEIAFILCRILPKTQNTPKKEFSPLLSNSGKNRLETVVVVSAVQLEPKIKLLDAKQVKFSSNLKKLNLEVFENQGDLKTITIPLPPPHGAPKTLNLTTLQFSVSKSKFSTNPPFSLTMKNFGSMPLGSVYLTHISTKYRILIAIGIKPPHTKKYEIMHMRYNLSGVHTSAVNLAPVSQETLVELHPKSDFRSFSIELLHIDIVSHAEIIGQLVQKPKKFMICGPFGVIGDPDKVKLCENFPILEFSSLTGVTANPRYGFMFGTTPSAPNSTSVLEFKYAASNNQFSELGPLADPGAKFGKIIVTEKYPSTAQFHLYYFNLNGTEVKVNNISTTKFKISFQNISSSGRKSQNGGQNQRKTASNGQDRRLRLGGGGHGSEARSPNLKQNRAYVDCRFIFRRTLTNGTRYIAMEVNTTVFEHFYQDLGFLAVPSVKAFTNSELMLPISKENFYGNAVVFSLAKCNQNLQLEKLSKESQEERPGAQKEEKLATESQEDADRQKIEGSKAEEGEGATSQGEGLGQPNQLLDSEIEYIQGLNLQLDSGLSALKSRSGMKFIGDNTYVFPEIEANQGMAFAECAPISYPASKTLSCRYLYMFGTDLFAKNPKIVEIIRIGPIVILVKTHQKGLNETHSSRPGGRSRFTETTSGQNSSIEVRDLQGNLISQIMVPGVIKDCDFYYDLSGNFIKAYYLVDEDQTPQTADSGHSQLRMYICNIDMLKTTNYTIKAVNIQNNPRVCPYRIMQAYAQLKSFIVASLCRGVNESVHQIFVLSEDFLKTNVMAYNIISLAEHQNEINFCYKDDFGVTLYEKNSNSTSMSSIDLKNRRNEEKGKNSKDPKFGKNEQKEATELSSGPIDQVGESRVQLIEYEEPTEIRSDIWLSSFQGIDTILDMSCNNRMTTILAKSSSTGKVYLVSILNDLNIHSLGKKIHSIQPLKSTSLTKITSTTLACQTNEAVLVIVSSEPLATQKGQKSHDGANYKEATDLESFMVTISGPFIKISTLDFKTPQDVPICLSIQSNYNTGQDGLPTTNTTRFNLSVFSQDYSTDMALIHPKMKINLTNYGPYTEEYILEDYFEMKGRIHSVNYESRVTFYDQNWIMQRLALRDSPYRKIVNSFQDFTILGNYLAIWDQQTAFLMQIGSDGDFSTLQQVSIPTGQDSSVIGHVSLVEITDREGDEQVMMVVISVDQDQAFINIAFKSAKNSAVWTQASVKFNNFYNVMFTIRKLKSIMCLNYLRQAYTSPNSKSPKLENSEDLRRVEASNDRMFVIYVVALDDELNFISHQVKSVFAISADDELAQFFQEDMSMQCVAQAAHTIKLTNGVLTVCLCQGGSEMRVTYEFFDSKLKVWRHLPQIVDLKTSLGADYTDLNYPTNMLKCLLLTRETMTSNPIVRCVVTSPSILNYIYDLGMSNLSRFQYIDDPTSGKIVENIKKSATFENLPNYDVQDLAISREYIVTVVKETYSFGVPQDRPDQLKAPFLVLVYKYGRQTCFSYYTSYQLGMTAENIDSVSPFILETPKSTQNRLIPKKTNIVKNGEEGEKECTGAAKRKCKKDTNREIWPRNQSSADQAPKSAKNPGGGHKGRNHNDQQLNQIEVYDYFLYLNTAASSQVPYLKKYQIGPMKLIVQDYKKISTSKDYLDIRSLGTSRVYSMGDFFTSDFNPSPPTPHPSSATSSGSNPSNNPPSSSTPTSSSKKSPNSSNKGQGSRSDSASQKDSKHADDETLMLFLVCLLLLFVMILITAMVCIEKSRRMTNFEESEVESAAGIESSYVTRPKGVGGYANDKGTFGGDLSEFAHMS